MKHGEQLAPLIARCCGDARSIRQDLTAIAVGVGPGPFTGLRVGLVTARTLGLGPRDPGATASARSTCSRSRPSTPARSAATSWWRRTPAARRSTSRRTTPTGARLDGPDGGPPGRRPPPTCPVVGEGAVLYPEAFPHAVGPARPSAGWLARVVAEERAELLDPEPLYLRRPDAVAPGKPKRVS